MIHPSSSLRHSLTAIFAAAMLAACGGGGDSNRAGPQASEDDADAATLAEVATILDSVNAQIERSAAPGVGGQGANGTTGRFPGLEQTNLVANKPEYGAQILEPDLQNAWGIAIRPAGFGGHWWVASTNVGQSIQYVGDVGGTPLFQDELEIVHTLGPVTGIAFNHGSGFAITQAHENGPITAPAKFFFANISGTITAWTERARAGGGFDHPVDSVPVVDGTARRSAFFGVAVAPGADRMFAADFGAEPALRAYDGQFAETGVLASPFEKKPGGFEAFNVQTIGQSVFAMYGRHVPPGTENPPAEGRLAEFDAEGKLLATWRGRGLLNYPWGVALAPKDFGLYGGCLLVGNFGDGTLVAFHPRLKVALDYVRDEHGKRVVIDGLWGLQFGNGASLGEADHMYFAAGPERETDGLFGKLQRNPNTPALLRGVSLCR